MKEFRGFFKIIPIAIVMIVIAAVIGLVGFGVQKCSADNLDEITSAEITADGYTNNEIGDTMPPRVLINVRLRVVNEWGEFWGDFNSTNPYFVKTDNIFYALLIALRSEGSDAKGLSDAINVVDNFARELREIQAGRIK